MHPDVIIGENCTILQQVTIGNDLFKGENDLAVIKNNVLIGAGAKIIGPCSIGNNVTIGANSVVVRDVDCDQVVGGIPARHLSSKVSVVHNYFSGN
ncbi:serine O-acetyltransferase [Agarivorans albus]|uniref:serine O-acetyltransferase n=1 Tax=Agarivorans albus TaxID=182262 RepID=UPI000684C28D